jgi:hypothetical protein
LLISEARVGPFTFSAFGPVFEGAPVPGNGVTGGAPAFVAGAGGVAVEFDAG